MPTTDQLMAIHQLIGLYGHVIDEWQIDRLGELYAPDAVFDLSAMGLPVLAGLDGIRAGLERMRAERIAKAGPTVLAHLSTNIHVEPEAGMPGRFRVMSKTLLVTAGDPNRVVTGLYIDSVAETPAGWRILRRTAQRAWAAR